MCHIQIKCQSQVYTVDDDEQLLTIVSDRTRLFSYLNVNGKAMRFLLDCGGNVNLLPRSTTKQINSGLMRFSPAKSTLRMLDSMAL